MCYTSRYSCPLGFSLDGLFVVNSDSSDKKKLLTKYRIGHVSGFIAIGIQIFSIIASYLLSNIFAATPHLNLNAIEVLLKVFINLSQISLLHATSKWWYS